MNWLAWGEKMFERSLLKDSDVGALGEAVLAVLDEIGAMYQNDEILSALGAAGARIDRGGHVAKFPRKMVAEFLDELRKDAPCAEGDDGDRPFHAPGQGVLFHQLAQYVYDAKSQERRLGNKEDYIRLLKLGDMLHPEQGVGHCLLLSDIPAPIEPLEATLLQFEYVHHPRGAYVQDVRQIDYLIEIEKISGINGLHWLANVGFSSPLRLGKDVADRFAYKVKKGGRGNVYVMTISGAGTPVTVAGSIVIASAEILANWMAARALNPDVPISAGVWIATMDMKTGESSYMAFDALIRCFGTREFMRRWTGMPVGVGGGQYCPAKVPGPYAALEKAYRAMTVAAFTGQHPGIGSGDLDGGLTISPEQLLLDRELAEALNHLAEPIEVTSDSIALDTILDVGHASKTSFLESEHTLRYFRSALWLPQIMERAGWTGAESEQRVVEKAQERVDELIAVYEKPAVDADKLERIRRVVRKATRDLC